MQAFYEGLLALRHIPETDRPRERLLQEGEKALALWELLAILIGTGTKGKSAVGIARELLARFKSLDLLLDASISELTEIKGMGKVKAVKLKAAFALALRSRRPHFAHNCLVDSAQKVCDIARYEIGDYSQEVIFVILRDIKKRLIHCEKVSVGTLSEVLVHPREIFYPAIRHRAHSLVLVHNHPSGDPSPSMADVELTKSLLEASRIIGIELWDHVILGRERFLSFRESEILTW